MKKLPKSIFTTTIDYESERDVDFIMWRKDKNTFSSYYATATAPRIALRTFRWAEKLSMEIRYGNEELEC